MKYLERNDIMMKYAVAILLAISLCSCALYVPPRGHYGYVPPPTVYVAPPVVRVAPVVPRCHFETDGYRQWQVCR